MSDELRQQIYLNFSHRATEELLEIWQAHDCDAWSETTFEVIREILQQRHVEPPPHGSVVHETRNSRRADSRGGHQPHAKPTPQKKMLRSAEHRGLEQSRPQTVTCAVYLAAGALAIQSVLAASDLVTGQYGPSAAGRDSSTVCVPFGLVGVMALEAFLIYGIWLGRSGARIAWIGLILISMVGTVAGGGWAEAFAARPLRTAVAPLLMCLELVASVLLVARPSNAWFRNMRALTRQASLTPGNRARGPSEGMSDGSGFRWPPVAASFVLALILNALAIVIVDLEKYGGQLAGAYVTMCLPVSATILAVGALIGARLAAGRGGGSWKGAVAGIWVGVIPSVVLTLWALLRIGPGE